MSASVRGIGVAVMCSTCGARPCASALRCSTPKRCCSSTTATERSRSSTPSWMSACVPTTTSAPSAVCARLLRRRAREQRARDAELGADALDREEVLLGERLGRRHQRALAAVLDRAQDRVERDDRLAGADVALQEPLHRHRALEVGVDLAHGLLLVRRQRERQRLPVARDQLAGRAERRRERALALGRAARDPDLEQQQLLEGEPRAADLRLALGLRAVDRRRARRASAASPRARAARPAAGRSSRRRGRAPRSRACACASA